jgi:hypothetical protein
VAGASRLCDYDLSFLQLSYRQRALSRALFTPQFLRTGEDARATTPHGKIRPAEGDFAGVYREQKIGWFPCPPKSHPIPLIFRGFQRTRQKATGVAYPVLNSPWNEMQLY